eukprot:1690999-Rhodomonas_salina.1
MSGRGPRRGRGELCDAPGNQCAQHLVRDPRQLLPPPAKRQLCCRNGHTAAINALVLPLMAQEERAETWGARSTAALVALRIALSSRAWYNRALVHYRTSRSECVAL